MMFARRVAPTWSAWAMSLLWPRCGIWRATLFHAKRLVRLAASPHAVAAGLAAGIFVSFTPFVGLHLIGSIVIALALGGSALAAVIGTWVGNPLTYPLFWIAGYEVGEFLLGEKGPIDVRALIAHPSLEALMPYAQQLTVGSIVLGLVAAFAAYVPVRILLEKHRAIRLRALALRRASRLPAAP